ncbi:uncharacterized protein K02A2.6-like [Xenia sp. Carnegie-2017]|uniref:uncharacterized protein K02A2.6-like n=1 Tax=Xenia sp. Carnegie-2017 TaxID=2897299 RepID=UPI001F035086|nr:uncharacterized protein K02A2.6-like [Xenia sp. Carnegie-2017]
MIQCIDYAHSEIVSTLARARESTYWPGISKEVRQFIELFNVCRSLDKQQPKEIFVQHDIPHRPLTKVETDLFTYNECQYLICVDYYSSFWEVDLLESTLSETVNRKLKAQSARYGIPEVVMSDNGPLFSLGDFKEFCQKWNIHHVTSSPTYPRSNGKMEATVKSAKMLMKKAKKARRDPSVALLEYRNTPTHGLNSSPVVRLISRQYSDLF